MEQITTHETPVVEALPLTDEELAALIASEGVFVSSDDTDETDEDRVLN